MIYTSIVLAVGLLIMLPNPRARVDKQVVKTGLRIRAGPFPGLGTRTSDPLDTAADIEIFAACLDSGLSIKDAAQVVARVADHHSHLVWAQVVALLSIGVGPPRAFLLMAGMDGLDELANLATVSHRSGSALSKGCIRIAQGLRDASADHRTSAAERAGVFIALPLATCFLPAFMIIGLAPVVLSLGSQLINF